MLKRIVMNEVLTMTRLAWKAGLLCTKDRDLVYMTWYNSRDLQRLSFEPMEKGLALHHIAPHCMHSAS